MAAAVEGGDVPVAIGRHSVTGRTEARSVLLMESSSGSVVRRETPSRCVTSLCSRYPLSDTDPEGLFSMSILCFAVLHIFCSFKLPTPSMMNVPRACNTQHAPVILTMLV